RPQFSHHPTHHNLPSGDLVDELGALKARIADLEAPEKLLRAELIDRRTTCAEGSVYSATVTGAVRWTLGSKAVRAEKERPRFRVGHLRPQFLSRLPGPGAQHKATPGPRADGEL